ncbi:uncharacterized protein LOC100572800 isoform X1 [Acyrthosiphon pisum]|uniref:ACYPI25200 protein n=1 Tax=Acyrthosiphon pisum TaxID=7029 RepID=C4WWU4_ACYPI|nr:uncharacterized protein LOC100572800 [Acyrthosiphon pisum]XP_008181921.1 uncharacterized protein LOC100572800 isoform X1 [Acyrthosiphon pisum]BAH72364.1 ACYPI25200 [Acyrthosiphon pisum]|eukprot:NP_001233025.1 uncharacterized protein LOC100572800 [Acyrthosiphon pisum]
MDRFKWKNQSNSNIQLVKVEKNLQYIEINGCLPDTLVNKYMDLITKFSPNKYYAFNTHFFTAFDMYGFSRIHRWTKNIDIFSKKRLFIPIYLKSKEMWSLIYVNFKHKSIRYYDSHGNHGLKYQRLILKYLKLEYLMKKGKFFPSAGWKYTNLNSLDDAYKCWDSGIFLCLVAHHFALNFSKDATLPFSSKAAGGEKVNRERIERELINDTIRNYA